MKSFQRRRRAPKTRRSTVRHKVHNSTRKVRRGGLRGGTTPALQKELDAMRRNNSRRALFNNAIKLKPINYDLKEFLNKIGLNKPNYNSLSDVQKKYVDYQHRKFMASMLNGNSINSIDESIKSLKNYYEYYSALSDADKALEDEQYVETNE